MIKEKIILDTDIADDIDDALALALALQMPEIELLGVTTAFLDTMKRARVARKMLKLWDRDIPVYAGVRLGVAGWQNADSTPCQYTTDLESGEYEPINNSYEDGGQGAVDFILECAEKYRDELTIVMIGPMMNVAEAIKRDPETMRRIKRIVLMGGSFYEQFCEWNVWCDPESADIVEKSGIDCTWIGTDVTWATRLNDAQQQQLMTADQDQRYSYLANLVRLHYAKNKRNATLHDPLALYYVIHPEILTTAKALTKVELKGTFTKGMTVNYDSLYRYLPEPISGRRQTIGKTVQAEKFLKEFFSLLFPAEN